MMINIKRKKKYSANSGNFIQKCICHEHNMLRLNISAICAQDVTTKKNCNNKGIITETVYYLFNLFLTSAYKSLRKCSKLIRTYHIFLFHFAAVLANDSSRPQEEISSPLGALNNMHQLIEAAQKFCHCFKRSRARRKRNKIIQEKQEEEKYEMELLKRQMKLLQIQQQKMYQQQMGPFTPRPVLMQGAAAQDMKKNKNSKNDKLSSTNCVLKVGYNAS